MGIPKDKWKLGERTANAPTFENILTRDTPRTDIPSLKVNQKGIEDPELKVPPNDIHQRIAQTLLNRAIDKKSLSKEYLTKVPNKDIQNSTVFQSSELTGQPS
jgi:hypothetical protein